MTVISTQSPTDSQKKGLWEELVEAVQNADIQKLEQHLAHAPEWARTVEPRAGNAPRTNRTLLMVAAESGQVASLLSLLPHRDPAAENGHGLTALHHAILQGHEACTEALLPVSRWPCISVHADASLFTAASRQGNINFLRLLLNKMRAQYPEFNPIEALELMAWQGNAKVLAWLIPICLPQASDRSEGSFGEALKKAAQDRHLECVRLLLPHCTCANDQDARADALEMAIYNEDWNCVDLLASSESAGKSARIKRQHPLAPCHCARHCGGPSGAASPGSGSGPSDDPVWQCKDQRVARKGAPFIQKKKESSLRQAEQEDVSKDQKALGGAGCIGQEDKGSVQCK